MTRSKPMKFTAVLAVAAVGFASPAAASARAVSAHTPAAGQARTVSPWVALSALASSSSSAALCGATAAASSSAAQVTAPGCVLPAVDAPPPVVQVPEPSPVAAVPATTRGFSILPLLLGLAGVAAIAALILAGGDDDSDINVEPISRS